MQQYKPWGATKVVNHLIIGSWLFVVSSLKNRKMGEIPMLVSLFSLLFFLLCNIFGIRDFYEIFIEIPWFGFYKVSYPVPVLVSVSMLLCFALFIG